MEKPLKGDIVVLPFPFTDLTATKRRPALVIATLKGDDLLVAQITSQTNEDPYSIPLEDNQILGGKLDGASYIRPNKIFTADKSILLYKIGKLNNPKMKEVEEKIIKIIRN
ncbi:MAG: type II toxin-antitoxin system PemK/MazF family toxin [archaeon]